MVTKTKAPIIKKTEVVLRKKTRNLKLTAEKKIAISKLKNKVKDLNKKKRILSLSDIYIERIKRNIYLDKFNRVNNNQCRSLSNEIGDKSILIIRNDKLAPLEIQGKINEVFEHEGKRPVTAFTGKVIYPDTSIEISTSDSILNKITSILDFLMIIVLDGNRDLTHSILTTKFKFNVETAINLTSGNPQLLTDYKEGAISLNALIEEVFSEEYSLFSLDDIVNIVINSDGERLSMILKCFDNCELGNVVKKFRKNVRNTPNMSGLLTDDKVISALLV